MKYKSVVATKRGGPEVLQIIENDLRPPDKKEARIKILAAGVGRTDINYRYGLSPFAPKVPFVPGYEIMGIVDAVGEGVTQVRVGDRVAALTGHGGYSEMIYLGQEHLVPVPESLEPADVVTVVLNYVSAYQMLHRVAKVKTGDRVLINGASGGMGTALLELGKLAGLKMRGTASQSKHNILTQFGAIPIDYHTQNFVEVIRQDEPNGLDFVFEGMGGDHGDRALSVLRRGGKLVAYAAPVGLLTIVKDALKLVRISLLSNGKKAEFYGDHSRKHLSFVAWTGTSARCRAEWKNFRIASRDDVPRNRRLPMKVSPSILPGHCAIAHFGSYPIPSRSIWAYSFGISEISTAFAARSML